MWLLLHFIAGYSKQFKVLFAVQDSPEREDGETRTIVILLTIDQQEIRLRCCSTWKDSCKATKEEFEWFKLLANKRSPASLSKWDQLFSFSMIALIWASWASTCFMSSNCSSRAPISVLCQVWSNLSRCCCSKMEKSRFCSWTAVDKALMAGLNSQRRCLQNLVQLEWSQHHWLNQQTYDQHSSRLVHTPIGSRHLQELTTSEVAPLRTNHNCQ